MISRWVMVAILHIFRCGVWLNCNSALKGAGGYSGHIKAQANAWVINQSKWFLWLSRSASPSELPPSGSFSCSRRQTLSDTQRLQMWKIMVSEIWFYGPPAPLHVPINPCCINSTSMMRFIPQVWWWDCQWVRQSSTALETTSWFQSATHSPLHAGMGVAWFLFYSSSSPSLVKKKKSVLLTITRQNLIAEFWVFRDH